MTVVMATLGLMPATIFVLFVFPLIVQKIYGKILYDKHGKMV